MVEWKKLGEICVSLKKEIIKQDNLVTNGKYPVVNSGVTLYGRYNEYNNVGNAFTFASRGEYAGFLTYMSEDFWAGGLCYPYRSADEEIYLTKFIYEYLKSQELYVMDRLVARGGIPALNKADVEKILIPIPSMAEQTRIVGILDTFTASIENLKQQIAQRRKQYNWIIDHFYYSDKYEMIKAAGEGKVQVKTMDEIGTFIRGRRFVRTDIVQEGVPCIHYGDMYTYYGVWADKTPTFLTKEKASKLRFAQKGDVIIVAAGENDIDIGVGVAWLGENEVVVHDACFIFKHEMDPKYISYFLRSMNYHLQIRMGVVDGKICSISAKELGRTLVPVPSLPEQQRIVSILDTFEASIANLGQQLAQREKQYEYYRNKLLTFE